MRAESGHYSSGLDRRLRKLTKFYCRVVDAVERTPYKANLTEAENPRLRRKDGLSIWSGETLAVRVESTLFVGGEAIDIFDNVCNKLWRTILSIRINLLQNQNRLYTLNFPFSVF